MTEQRRVFGLVDLVLFNLVVVFSLRGMTTAAKMGPVAVPLWLLAVGGLLIPLGLGVAEMATRDPGAGGLYRWVRAAFGDSHGFLAGWFYWVSNLTYLPTLLVFIAGNVVYLTGHASLGEDRVFVVSLSLGILGAATWLNVRGFSLGKLVTNAGALASWLAAVLLIAAGAAAAMRYGMATPLDARAFAELGSPGTLAWFGTLSFALVGLELAPVMGGEIREPRRNVPRALLWAGVLIAVMYVAGTLAIMAAVPPADVSPISGAVGALEAVGRRAGWGMLPVLGAAFVAFSATAGFVAWLGGMARLPYAVGLDRFLPARMAALHPRHGTPAFAIVFQAALTGVFVVASQMGATVREAYVVLLDTTIVLNFIPFLYMFAALPRLRPREEEPDVVRVPGGRPVLWLVATSGFAVTLLTLGAAVVPPGDVTDALLFEGKLWGVTGLFGLMGYVMFRGYRARGAS